jgi:hypothetical protein
MFMHINYHRLNLGLAKCSEDWGSDALCQFFKLEERHFAP